MPKSKLRLGDAMTGRGVRITGPHFFKTASLALWCGATLTASSVFADIKVFVTTPDGHRPYMFVLPQDDSDLKDDQGVYIADEKGKWHQIVRGRILAGRTVQGVLAQFETSKNEERFTSAAVIDGKLTVFNLKTKTGDPESSIILGSADAPFVDILNNTELNIPAIDSVDDISIQLGPSSIDGQIMLGSIRLKTPTLQGDGITFAIFVKNPEVDSNRLKLVASPAVIDYRFRSTTELKNLLDTKSPMTGVVSENIIRSLSRGRNNDPRPVTRWRTELRAPDRDIGHGTKNKELPYYDVVTGETVIPIPLVASVGQMSKQVYQIYDPLRGFDGIVVTNSSPLHTNFTFSKVGRIDISPYNRHLWFQTNKTYNRVALTSIQKRLTVVFDEGEEPYFLPLHYSPEEIPEHFSHVVFAEPKKGSEEAKYYIITSSKTKDHEETRFYFIRKNGLGYENVRNMRVLKRYFTTEELLARTFQNGGKLLFDNLTPPQKSIEAYRQTGAITTPHVDLLRSKNEDTLVQDYRQPLQETFINDFVVHRVYDARGAKENHSGLVIQDDEKNVESTIRGELLRRRDSDRADLGIRVVNLPNNRDLTANLSVIAIDAAMEKGTGGFSLVSAASYAGYVSSSRAAPRPASQVSRIPASFTQLNGIFFLAGGNKLSEVVHLLLRFDPTNEPGSTMKEGGLYALTLRVQLEGVRESDRRYTVEKVRDQWLTTTAVSENELQTRLRRDTVEGKLYFVATPEIDPLASEYKLVQVMSGADVLPNTARDRTKKFIAEEQSGDAYTNLGTQVTGNASAWEIFSPGRLKDRSEDGLLKFFLEKEHSEKLAESESLFPHLREFLESLANAQSKNERRVFIVPHHIKAEFLKAAYFLLADRESRGYWSFRNPRLKFYLFDRARASQSEVIDSLTAMRTLSAQNKVMLFADAKDLIKIGRPAPLSDGPDNEHQAAFEIPVTEPGQSEPVPTLPHALYWLVTEGERLSLDKAAARGHRESSIATSIIATPSEWRQLVNQADYEKDAGVLDGIRLDTTFMQGSWKVWPPGTPKTKDRVQRTAQLPFSEFENDVFPDLARVLSEASSLEREPKHQILLVPPELKANVGSLVLSRWVHATADPGPWRHNNPALSVAWLDPSLAKTQSEALENLDALRLAPPNTRSVLIGDLAEVAEIGRSMELDKEHEEFYLSEIIPDEEFFREKDKHQPVTVSEAKVTPHILYLLETEGRKLQLRDFETTSEKPHVSELLIGTEAEWAQIQADLSPEDQVKLADRFEVIELPAPSIEIRKTLLRRIFERPEIQNIRYTFDAKGILTKTGSEKFTQEQEREALLGMMVNRCESLSNPRGKGVISSNVISSFVKMLNATHLTLIEDKVLRHRKVIDRVFVEAVFAKIFTMKIDVSVLPGEDPLKVLSQDDAAMKLHRAGYKGKLEFNAGVIDAILAQTENDPVISMPSSIILYGEPRTGKTFLFKTLCEMLELKMYDFARPSDTSAQAMFINVAKLKPSEKTDKEVPLLPSHSEVMTVDQMLRHLQNFLSLPNGYRGFVLLDDLHFAPDEVRAQIIAILRSLFDATNGLYRAKNYEGRIVEVPTRNIVLMMTANPPDEVDKSKKYDKKGDDIEQVLASLSGPNVKVDRSFLERWRFLLNLDKFPPSAKAPKLRDDVRVAARDTFNTQNRLILVSPTAIQKVSEEFKDENASFLSRATPALISRTSEFSEQPTLSIVVPRTKRYGVAAGSQYATSWSEASGRSGTAIDSYIENSTLALPIVGRMDGQFEMLRLLIDTYRAQVYENFVEAISQDPYFTGTQRVRREMLSPVLHSVVAHLTTHPRTPVNTLLLDPSDFGVTTPMQRASFQKLVDEHSENSRGYFPVKFGDEIPAEGLLASFLDHTLYRHEERTRAQVLTETVDSLRPHFEKLLQTFLRVESLHTLPNEREWLHSLQMSDPTETSKQMGIDLSNQFREFYDAMFADGLTEIQRADRYANMSIYDAARLYLIALDKTLTKLPWAKALQFVVRGLDLASRHMELGQLPGVQHYIFTSEFSAARPTTNDWVLQVASHSKTYRGTNVDTSKRMAQLFVSKCKDLLVQPQGGGDEADRK